MKIVITGAAGQISYSLVPFLCEKGIFNSDEKIDLALVEIPATMERLDGFVDDNSLGVKKIVSLWSPNGGFDSYSNDPTFRNLKNDRSSEKRQKSF